MANKGRFKRCDAGIVVARLDQYWPLERRVSAHRDAAADGEGVVLEGVCNAIAPCPILLLKLASLVVQEE